MSKLEIKLDDYKEFLHSEHGFKLITQIIENYDYVATKQIAQWEQCAPKALEKIAIMYMVVGGVGEIKDYLKMLEWVAENPKTSVKTLSEILDFAVSLVKDYRYYASEVLDEIAESKKLTKDIATTLYKVALENGLNDVVEELTENKNTPDDILYNILERFDDETKAYRNASKQIIKRYKKLKEKLFKEDE